MGCSASVKAIPNEPTPITYATFDYISVIGEGGFATVRSAVKRKGGDNKILAIKEINLAKVLSTDNKNGIKSILNELHALKAVDYHPFIVKLHYAFRNDTRVYLVFDSLSGGDLRLHLRNGHIFSETSVAYYIACIGSALNHLHIRNIMHRDVKPENIILDSRGVPYLTDFGISFMGQDNKVALCHMSSGTLAYLAPEVLTPSHRHSFQSDFWSLGVVGYELLYGKRPFVKHCPKEFVYFVENKYRKVWDRLESDIDCGMFDWSDEELITREECIIPLNLPYPKHYIPLLPNGDLPEVFKVQYPAVYLCGTLTSAACVDLLDSLLDVRIHKRYGTISQFIKFTNHTWFLNQLPYEKSRKLLKYIVPQFRPDPQLVERSIASRYSQNNGINSGSPSSLILSSSQPFSPQQLQQQQQQQENSISIPQQIHIQNNRNNNMNINNNNVDYNNNNNYSQQRQYNNMNMNSNNMNNNINNNNNNISNNHYYQKQQQPQQQQQQSYSHLSPEQQSFQLHKSPPSSSFGPPPAIFQHIIPSTLNIQQNNNENLMLSDDIIAQLADFYYVSPDYQQSSNHTLSTVVSKHTCVSTADYPPNMLTSLPNL